MWNHVRGGLLLAVLGLIPIGFSATPAAAQLFSRGCRNCQRPVTHCNCQPHQPVIETQMVPQQVTMLRNEVVTQYRQEAITQNVPVTTYHDVVVDEGSYQTVYVPKQVTKRIPQVTYQQQIAHRSVPYQVTRQVPQVVTQLVPQRQVRYQPYSYQTTQVAQTSVPVYGRLAPIAVVPCGPCGGMAFAPVAANPVTMLPPTSTMTPTIAVSSDADSHATPVPDPKFLDSPGAARDSWTTVGSKSGRPSDSADSRTASTRPSGVRFRPARTVYRSWESQSQIAAGEGPDRR